MGLKKKGSQFYISIICILSHSKLGPSSDLMGFLDRLKINIGLCKLIIPKNHMFKTSYDPVYNNLLHVLNQNK